MTEYTINPCSGRKIEANAGQTLTVIDTDGGQVVDFFAERRGDHGEFVSPGVTIDCNGSLRLSVEDVIYSNRYTPMFRVISDDVGEHDLIHPCCRPEMYEFFYHNGEGHSNCFDNINGALGTSHPVIRPINLFMYTRIMENGKVEVCPPLSKAGDKIVLEVLSDVTLGIAACSVSESSCNSGKCSSVTVRVE